MIDWFVSAPFRIGHACAVLQNASMPRATHFVAFPLWHDAAAVERVRGLLSSLELPIEAGKRAPSGRWRVDASLSALPFAPPPVVPLVAAESIHLTCGVAELGDHLGEADAPRSLSRAIDVLSAVAAELRDLSHGRPHALTLGHPGHFPEETRRERARVVYLRPQSVAGQPSTILDMATIVATRFKETGLFAGQRQTLNVRSCYRAHR